MALTEDCTEFLLDKGSGRKILMILICWPS